MRRVKWKWPQRIAGGTISDMLRRRNVHIKTKKKKAKNNYLLHQVYHIQKKKLVAVRINVLGCRACIMPMLHDTMPIPSRDHSSRTQKYQLMPLIS